MRALRTAALALLGAWGSARADGLRIDGEYDSPLGRVRVEGAGGSFRGVVVAPMSLMNVADQCESSFAVPPK